MERGATGNPMSLFDSAPAALTASRPTVSVPSQPTGGFTRPEFNRCSRCGRVRPKGTDCDHCAMSIANDDTISLLSGSDRANAAPPRTSGTGNFGNIGGGRFQSSSTMPMPPRRNNQDNHNQPDRGRPNILLSQPPNATSERSPSGATPIPCKEPCKMSNGLGVPPGENVALRRRLATYVPTDQPVNEMCYRAVVAGDMFHRLTNEISVRCESVGRNETMDPENSQWSSLEPRTDAKTIEQLQGLNPKLKDILLRVMLIEHMTAAQQHAIPLIMAGKEVLLRAETGSGKTLAYLVPIVDWLLNNAGDIPENSKQISQSEPKVLVLCPTRELAKQVYDEARKLTEGLTVKISKCYGGIHVRHNFEEMRNADLVVGTEGRVQQALNERYLNLHRLHFFVLDEADELVKPNRNNDNEYFKGSVRTIWEDFTYPRVRHVQTIMCSATFTPELQQVARDFFRPGFRFLWLGASKANRDVIQRHEEVPMCDKQQRLVKVIMCKLCENEDDKEALEECVKVAAQHDDTSKLGHTFKKKIMVFAERRRNVDYLSLYLDQQGIPNVAYHGDHPQEQREYALERFQRGDRPVLLVTDVAARGLDVPNVSLVINYDLPFEFAFYIHRIGRTARAGNTGEAVSFFDPRVDKDTGIAPFLKAVLDEVGQPVPAWLKAYC